jgi:hypothetical protein
MCYKGISWNKEDLISSKQALLILLKEGISEEEIHTLDFGSLDVDAIIDEYNND